jgi:hypothetical protein
MHSDILRADETDTGFTAHYPTSKPDVTQGRIWWKRYCGYMDWIISLYPARYAAAWK